ncbi:MAG: DUF4105 domain-containing protein [Rhodothermales bacterium]
MSHRFSPLPVFLLVCWVGLAGAPTSQAQRLTPLSPQARLSLVTVLPGEAAYELFGHSAIRLQDPVRGIDALFNYGTFQFDALFLPKFVYGELDYLLWVSAYQRELPHYRERGRSVIEQELRVTPAQRDAIVQFLEINAQPENRTYRYQFLADNCSTRIRDVLERTLDGNVRFSDAYENPGTYRALLDRYVDHLPFLKLGFYLVLGEPADRPADARASMFLPINLMEAFDTAEIRSDSAWMPLVVRTDTTYWNPRADALRSGYPVWPLTWLVLGLGAWLTWKRRDASDGVVPYFDRILFGVVGLAGALMFFLWFIALHDVTNQNWNLLWAWPTHLVAAGLMRRRPEGLRYYWMATACVSAIALLGWPLWPQALHPAVIPVVLLLVLRSGWLVWSTRRR